MIKSIFCSLLILLSSFCTGIVPDDKVLQAFQENFPGVQNATWYDYTDGYEVRFEHSNIKCHLLYNKKGEVVYARRYYTQEHLTPFILTRINQAYKHKMLNGVTEISSANGTEYHVVLEGEKHFYFITVDQMGKIMPGQRLKKSVP